MDFILKHFFIYLNPSKNDDDHIGISKGVSHLTEKPDIQAIAGLLWAGRGVLIGGFYMLLSQLSRTHVGHGSLKTATPH